MWRPLIPINRWRAFARKILYEAILIREIDPEQRNRGAGKWLRDRARRQDAIWWSSRTTRLWSFAKASRDGFCRGKSFSAGPTYSLTGSSSMTRMVVLATDVRYGDYKDYDGINFPTQIEIERPQEEYDITLNILKLELNKPIDRRTIRFAAADGRGSGSFGAIGKTSRRIVRMVAIRNEDCIQRRHFSPCAVGRVQKVWKYDSNPEVFRGATLTWARRGVCP